MYTCIHAYSAFRHARTTRTVADRTDGRRSRRPRYSRRERASDGEIVGEICLMFLSRTNPRLYTGVLQRGLREDLLAHQRKRQARGVPVPPRQVAAKRFRRQSGMTSTSDLDPVSICYKRNEIDIYTYINKKMNKILILNLIHFLNINYFRYVRLINKFFCSFGCCRSKR